MVHPFDVRCCKVSIFFAFAQHVSCFFSRCFCCHMPYCTVWHIFPTDNSCMASSCRSASILLPPIINPHAFRHQSYSLPQSILRPFTISPTASSNQSYSLSQSSLLPPGIFSLLYYMASLHYVPSSVLPPSPSR